MCIKCKACGSDMDMELIEGTEVLEFLCTDCKRKAAAAREMNEWDFEGLYWSDSESFPGIDGRMHESAELE